MDNAILRREIVDFGGALVTEYPMHTPVQRGAFQVRNRLISGMRTACSLRKRQKRAGALITAKYALEQNREVFVFIGEDEKAFSGCIALEEDGARAFTLQRCFKAVCFPPQTGAYRTACPHSGKISPMSPASPEDCVAFRCRKGARK